MKPKTRPNRLRAQQKSALREIREVGKTKVVSTFPRALTQYDHAVRRMQRRRVNPQYILAMLRSDDPVLRQVALKRLNLEPKILEKLSQAELRELAMHDDPVVAGFIARAFAPTAKKAPVRKKTLPELEKLASSPDRNDRINAAMELSLRGESALPILKNLAKDTNPAVRGFAEDAISKISSRKILLGTRKPFAATPHLAEVLKRADTLNHISSELKHEFGDGFVGIVVFGGTAKGYSNSKSDVDYAVVASNSAASKRFHELSQGKLPLCDEEHYVNPEKSTDHDVAPLFYGLFFGDRKALKRAQRSALLRFEYDPRRWNWVRKKILEHETNLNEAFERSSVGLREQRRIMAAAALRVPPPYEEMKKLLGIK